MVFLVSGGASGACGARLPVVPPLPPSMWLSKMLSRETAATKLALSETAWQADGELASGSKSESRKPGERSDAKQPRSFVVEQIYSGERTL